MKKAYTLGLYEKAMPDVSWPEKLKIAKEAGYDFVEISIDATEERISRVYSSKRERRELVELCWDLDMPIRTLNASALTKYSLGNPDPAVCARGMEIAERSVELAEDLGVRIVMIPGYDVYYEPHSDETERRFVGNIRRLERTAACAGVQLGFETMENEFMNTVEKALYYIGLVQSNYLKIYPDIGNTTNAAVLHGTDPIEDLRLGRGQLLALHLKETCPGHYREIPYGTGHVDFEAAVKTAWELGVRRYVTEFWYREGGETPAEVRARFGALLDRQI
jgi:L-ribulose-5-phosphate 3-epimerase